MPIPREKLIHPREHKYGWFTKLELCEILDCTPNNFDRAIKPKIPEKAVDQLGSAYIYHGRAVIELWAMVRVKMSHKARVALIGVIPGLNGDDEEEELEKEKGKPSPSLERLREEKFLIARLERQAMERSLVRRSAVEEALGKLATKLRDAGERIAKISSKAHAILNECLEQFGHEVEALEHKFRAED